jgi:hypothetical protein
MGTADQIAQAAPPQLVLESVMVMATEEAEVLSKCRNVRVELAVVIAVEDEGT